METIFVGIDVSKDRLDVHVRPSPEAFAVARDGKGLKELVERLSGLRSGHRSRACPTSALMMSKSATADFDAAKDGRESMPRNHPSRRALLGMRPENVSRSYDNETGECCAPARCRGPGPLAIGPREPVVDDGVKQVEIDGLDHIVIGAQAAPARLVLPV